jgi:hypothetical protein
LVGRWWRERSGEVEIVMGTVIVGKIGGHFFIANGKLEFVFWVA